MDLADALEDAGFTVIEANNADDAVRAFADRKDIDIVITDVQMPGSMDGIGLCKWLLDNQPGMPIIICTGRLQQPSDLQELHPSSFRMTAKPYLTDNVLDQVKELIG